MIKKISVIILTTSLLASCDCVKTVSGTVIDKNTSKPIVGAEVVIVKKPTAKSTTDSTGNYQISYVTFGPMCYLNPKIKVTAAKPGYKKTTEIEASKPIEMILDTANIIKAN